MFTSFLLAITLAAPAANAPLPTTPDSLTSALTEAETAVATEIDGWRADGDPSRGGAPDSLQEEALWQQRLYRHLARLPKTAQRTLARLDPPLRTNARLTIRALTRLFTLSSQTRITKRSTLRAGRAEPADRLLDHYRDAERRFKVGWPVLAAVNLVESGFNKLRNDSVAGARGPMQFIPSTWRAYGLGGDIEDPRDAIMGAANYLRASGAPADYRRALYAYNPSSLYVGAVLDHARRIKRDPRAFYAYYAWSVFVRTRTGERQLTGPGAG